MTEKDADDAHDVYQKLWTKIHKLVNKHTDKLTPEQDDYVRIKLHEEFRFWRTIK